MTDTVPVFAVGEELHGYCDTLPVLARMTQRGRLDRTGNQPRAIAFSNVVRQFRVMLPNSSNKRLCLFLQQSPHAVELSLYKTFYIDRFIACYARVMCAATSP